MIMLISAAAVETLKDMSEYIAGMKVVIGVLASVIGGMIVYLRTIDGRQQKLIEKLEHRIEAQDERIDACENDRLELHRKVAVLEDRQKQIRGER